MAELDHLNVSQNIFKCNFQHMLLGRGESGESSVCVQNWLLSLGRAKFECQVYLKLFFYVTFPFYAHPFRNKKGRRAQEFYLFSYGERKKVRVCAMQTI